MKYFFLAFRKWNDINGRANLKEFWYYTLFYFLFYFLFFFIDDVFINDFFLSTGEFVAEDFAEGGILTGLFFLINLIPSLTNAGASSAAWTIYAGVVGKPMPSKMPAMAVKINAIII